MLGLQSTLLYMSCIEAIISLEYDVLEFCPTIILLLYTLLSTNIIVNWFQDEDVCLFDPPTYYVRVGV
jgi:hypothetical protein